VEHGKTKCGCSVMMLCLALLSAGIAQQPRDPSDVPSHFKLDMDVASRLRPKLLSASTDALLRYPLGRLVFSRLIDNVHETSGTRFAWELRIVPDDRLNAFSSPDGTIFVESGLARLAGQSAGMWAAILSHEIAHVVRRDWARRYLYEKNLLEGSATIELGDPSLPAGDWKDSAKASEDLGRFCRRMEVEADRDGLMLMARAGYHPDFVPALHHLLHAQGVGVRSTSLYAMHPCWEERDRELARAYLAASIEFERRWPEWYASPGGNPPIVVFAEDPKARKTSTGWQVQIPLRCQNLAGAVEVVLRSNPNRATLAGTSRLTESPGSSELRQLTGCTSPRTTVRFAFVNTSETSDTGASWTDIYIVDARGSVLARTDMPKLPR